MPNRNKNLLWILIAAVAIVLIFAVSKILRPSAEVAKTNGTVVFAGIDTETKVFVDNERQQLKSGEERKSVLVTSGTRDILVSKDNYWPWLKQINIAAGGTMSLSPFLFPKNPPLEEIKQDDPEYDALQALTRNGKVPSEPNVLVSSDKSVTIWKNGAVLKALWISPLPVPAFFCGTRCEPEITFLKATSPIETVAFWRERNDLVLVAAGHDIYALELDRRPVQNFQPIYKGSAPTFALTKTGALYVRDNNLLYHINIDEQ